MRNLEYQRTSVQRIAYIVHSVVPYTQVNLRLKLVRQLVFGITLDKDLNLKLIMAQSILNHDLRVAIEIST